MTVLLVFVVAVAMAPLVATAAIGAYTATTWVARFVVAYRTIEDGDT